MTTEANRIIAALRDLQVGGAVTQQQGEWIAHLFGGDRSLFIELDERPGQFDHLYASGDWHWKLRQARNGCKRFFDVFGEDEREGHARAREQAIEALAHKHGRVRVEEVEGTGITRVTFFDRGLEAGAYAVAIDGRTTLVEFTRSEP